jgi:protein ImuB
MATMAAPLVWKQQELFNTESQRHREPLAHLIDLLAGRLGRRSVVAARLQRHPQPELVCQWRPLTGLRSDGQSQNTSRKLAKSPAKREATSLDEAAIGSQGQPRVGHWLAPSSYDHFRRPTQLYPSPQPLPIQTVDREGLPEHIDFQGDRHTIIQSWGPERIESGWWAGAHHRRDYYRVATDRGAWLWIYRELQQKRWFLHGVF